MTPIRRLITHLVVAAAISAFITPSAAQTVELDRAERQRVIDSTISNLKKHYVDSALAQRMAAALFEHEKEGDYESITDSVAFAALLTRQLREVSHDMPLEVIYSQSSLPEHPRGPTAESLARLSGSDAAAELHIREGPDPTRQYWLPKAEFVS